MVIKKLTMDTFFYKSILHNSLFDFWIKQTLQRERNMDLNLFFNKLAFRYDYNNNLIYPQKI